MKPTATIKLGTAFSIDILLHWSFFLLPLVVIVLSLVQGDSFSQTAVWIVLLLMILASVLVHEFGHALAARRLGIPILDIMLTPICGLARLERAPERPRDEIMVALAGPLANCIVAALVALVIWLVGEKFSTGPSQIRSSLLLILFWVNGSLFLLNLLPIFPMDGGRILRALLAMVVESEKATIIAARLGQLFSLIGIVTGFYWNVLPLVIIGVFLSLMAEQEIRLQAGARQGSIKQA